MGRGDIQHYRGSGRGRLIRSGTRQSRYPPSQPALTCESCTRCHPAHTWALGLTGTGRGRETGHRMSLTGRWTQRCTS